MKQRIINPAVFAYTLYAKFEDVRNILPLALFIVAPSMMLVISALFPHAPLNDEAQKQLAGMIAGYFASPVIGVMFSYFFVSDGPAGRKLISEADSLALLFTRPLTRFSYVISKFCAGLVGSMIAVSLGLILAYLTGFCIGIKAIDISPLAFASMFCNAASWTSLVVFLHSAPPLIGIITFLFFKGCSGIGDIFVRAEYTNDYYLELLKTICLFMHRWFGDIVPSSVNLGDMLSAASFDVYEAAIFVSNISLLLLAASFAMAKRGFFYGND